MGIFDGLIDQANQVLTQPTGGTGGTVPIPWKTGSDSTGVTYQGYTSPDGPYGSVYPPGTLYTVGSNGSISVDYTPPKASSGGGGTTINYNTQAANDLGPGRYTFVTSDGSDGLPPGSTYQKDLLDGSMSNIKLASGAAAQDPSGFDPRTGLPYGVIRDSNSPSGYLYQGQAVNADGSLYSGSAMGNDAKTWTGYGPKGQGTYYLDGPNGTPGTYIGATTNPASSSGSSGGSYTVSGPRVSSVGSSASSGGTARDYAAEQAAQNAAQAQMQKDAQAFNASQNALDRAQRDQEFQANYGLSVQQFQAQQAKDAAAARLGLIDRYGAAVSDTDQAKLQSLRMALGNGTGDVSLVDLLRNAGPGAFQANEAAAALLGEIRGQPASPTGTGMAPVTSPTGAGGTGTPATTGTPGMTPVTTPTGTTDPAVVAAQQAAAAAQQDATIRANIATNQRGADQQTISQNNAAITAWYDPKNWTNVGNNNPTGGGVDYMKSTITGESIPVGVWSQMMQDSKSAAQKETERATFWQGASVTPDAGGFNTYFAKGIPGTGTDSLGQAYGMSSQTFDPTLPNYTGPVAGTMPYGNDNVSNPMPTGNLANDNIQRPLPPTQPQAVLPMVAHGTERPMMGPIVTGDPQVPGQPNPELTVWTPQGNIVRPLNQMHPMMRPVMDGLPHAARGTNVFSSPWARFGRTTPTTQAAIGLTAPTPVATTTAPVTQPAPAPQQQPITQQPQPVTNTQPAMQPVTQPAPTTVGGTTVTTTPTPNPADPLALTPQSTQYINDVANFRTNLQYPHLNQLDVSWGRLAPSLQQSNMQGVQTATGLPIADQQYWQNRFAFAGRPTMNAVAGY